MDKNINTGRALSVGGEDIRPSRDVQSLLIPESPVVTHGEYVTRDSASSLIQYFDYTIEYRARLHYFRMYGKELED